MFTVEFLHMTRDQYEASYLEALYSIPVFQTSQPYLVGGERFVLINGVSCSDFQVFERAWGSRVASEIVRQSTDGILQRRPVDCK